MLLCLSKYCVVQIQKKLFFLDKCRAVFFKKSCFYRKYYFRTLLIYLSIFYSNMYISTEHNNFFSTSLPIVNIEYCSLYNNFINVTNFVTTD